MVPNKVNIAGIEYMVNQVEGLAEEQEVQGQVFYHKGLIKIDANMTEDKKEQTFVHEMFHAIMEEAGFQEQEEETVSRLSNVLYQVLKDNSFAFGKEPGECL
ncbi:ImmA/IrrE family metallo-endopeptidase [Robertmurraya kyonggiensis]|uniref:ImmA/IrrE family metallo-endopeptidase n=1 Tax=Robertmurraya kyonggiensis TaxID=1037680 RepID=A0A4U1D396_9BACI|nr:ImmA/IrrE family metallo-endopeptidase [Robertmurraya kyonggiensis]TKC15687.1 ImmA/IrrE family metallo-endopeptidase [Robertmurraya kyonggiensis]